MIPFCTLLRLNGAAMFSLSILAVAAPAPQHIDVQKVSTTVENVVVPRPDEVFGALNKLGGFGGENADLSLCSHCLIVLPQFSHFEQELRSYFAGIREQLADYGHGVGSCFDDRLAVLESNSADGYQRLASAGAGLANAF